MTTYVCSRCHARVTRTTTVCPNCGVYLQAQGIQVYGGDASDMIHMAGKAGRQAGQDAAKVSNALIGGTASVIGTAISAGQGNKAATTSMLFGWLTFLTFWTGVLAIPFALIGIITGHRALNAINRSGGTLGGIGPARIGLLFSYLFGIIGLLCLIAYTIENATGFIAHIDGIG